MKIVCRVVYKGFDDEPVEEMIRNYLTKKFPDIFKKARLMRGSSGFNMTNQQRDIDYAVNFDPKKFKPKATKFKKGIYAVEVLIEK